MGRKEPGAPSSRYASIDILRGAVMILMAIDHVRVFAGVPAGGPSPGVFFTRWVTHFCAPVFVFLAGTSAFLYARGSAERRAGLPRFLITRGLWLILLELTVLRICWTFNLDFAHYLMAGVIWVIGCSMIALAGLSRLPVAVTGAFGIVLIAGHNLFDPFLGEKMKGLAESGLSGLWKILYLGFFAGPVRLGENGPGLMVLYSLVPWVGVMAAGYAFGALVTGEPERRDRVLRALGLGAITLFLLLRGFNLYGDPRPWGDGSPMPGWLSFLNTSKYPASLLFLLMTLGPAIALMPSLDRARGRLAEAVTLFGRVPFFYYLLHIPLIHALALVVSKLRTGAVDPWLFANHPMGNPPPPDGYAWSLPLLYGVFAATLVILYFPCRWFAGVKARRRDWWLSYL